MAGHQKDPLRHLTPDERLHLERLSRSRAEPAAQVARATALLAVAAGASYAAAARAAGRRSGDAVARLVARFNREGLDAVAERHGGGQPRRYTQAEQGRILQEIRRAPDRDADGTATWSLATLQRALRRAADGLPGVSTSTLWGVLHDAGFAWGKDRSWCETGTAVRKRKAGAVTVVDPDATPKKTWSRRPTSKRRYRYGPRTRPGPTRRSRIPAPAGTRRASRRAIRTSMCATGRPSN